MVLYQALKWALGGKLGKDAASTLFTRGHVSLKPRHLTKR